MISDSNPVFVKIDRYKEIMDTIDVIEKKIVGIRQVLIELDEIKQREDQEIRTWEKTIDDVATRLGTIKDDLSI